MLERLLDAIGNREDIITDGVVYLRRWRLFGFNAKLPYLFGRSVMLHWIKLPDGDRDPHNHPWDFWSFVLKGWYVEHVYGNDDYMKRPRGRLDVPWALTRKWLWFGRRPAEHMHRIDQVSNGGAWTLVMTKQRPDHKWGFWTENGWVYWKWYIAYKQSQGIETTASRSAS